jgi:hypothetical protein
MSAGAGAVPRLDAGVLRPLYRVSFWKPAAHLVCVVAAIAGAICVASLSGNALVYLLAGLLIGALQHHLSILNHEANHFLLFRWRPLNEFVRAASAWATGFRLDYRVQHASHHRSLGAADDPDLPNYLHYPLPPRAFVADLLWHLSGLAAAAQFLRQSQPDAAAADADFLVRSGESEDAPGRPLADPDLLGVIGVQALIAGAIFFGTGSIWNYPLLWLLPLATVAKSLAHFRNVVEHTRTQDVVDAAL